jgi:CRISPR-associated endonuclease Csy4
MDHYMDIRLRSDPDFASIELLGALLSKLHRTLARRAKGDIGISFPNYRGNYLGDHLRLHATKEALLEFMQADWLAGMRDHVIVGTAAVVPVDARHRVVRRVQAKSSPERLRRRLMRRHGLTVEQAQRSIPSSAAQRLELPHVQLRSASTGQRFPLFVEHCALASAGQRGAFSSYGLSDTATVPWF